MLGTIVNAIAIIAGVLIGLIFKKGISEKLKETILQGIGLAIILIGLKMGFQANNELIVIVSLVIGGIIGELIGIDNYLDVFGNKLQEKVGSKDGDFVKGFVTATLIFCVGAMAIMGSIESGLNANHKILFVKSMLDFTMATILASSLGIGVIFSVIPVFLYQGGITLAAAGVKGILIEPVISYLTATGGMLIVGIGLNTLKIKEVNVANLLPAVFVVVFATLIALRFFPGYI